MATITKRKVAFTIMWDKDDPTNLTWAVKVKLAAITDDSETGGEKIIRTGSEPTVMSRTSFNTKTGADIQTLMINKSTEILQALGSGAGGHTIVDDLE